MYKTNISHPQFFQMKATRDGISDALLQAGKRCDNFFVLSANLASSMRLTEFAHTYPDRCIECGVAEQNMASVAAGLASEGNIVVIASFAVFSPGRNWDQIRVSIAYERANVKIIGGHTGLATGSDGATHQALEDIALMTALPNMRVYSPCDAVQTQQMLTRSFEQDGPCYIRVARENVPIFTDTLTPLSNSIDLVEDGSDVTLLATGPMLYETLKAASLLRNERIEPQILFAHTLKPFDASGLVKHVKATNALVTIEDHQIFGGLGSIAASALSQSYPCHIEHVGVRDLFGQSGSAKELYRAYQMDAQSIVLAAKKVLTRKNQQKFVQ